MSDKSQWQALVRILEPDFTLISIDLTGYGDTPMPQNPGQFSTEDEVRHVQNFILDVIGPAARFHLIGHSYGGAIALSLVHKLAPQVLSLCIFEPAAFYLLDQKSGTFQAIKQIVLEIRSLLQTGCPGEATRVFVDYWSGNGTFDRLSPDQQQGFVRRIEKVRLDFQALFNERLNLEDFRHVRLPVCLIKGTQSPLATLEILGILAHTLPANQVHTVPGGHMAPITHFQGVNRVIAGFIKGQEKISSRLRSG